MHSPPRGRAGFTLVETIGAVLILSILLALAAPSIAHALRVRQAEAVLTHDLHNAASAWEQAYLRDGRYPPLQALPGLAVSPGVAVDSQSVTDERVYLRLRHLPTGQRCALDYSRSSPVARNRADCYGGGQARDTALTITVEPPPAGPVDTFGIRPPEPPDTAGNPLALASPTVDSPTSQRVPPGAARTQAFTVVNRSPVPRSFRFEAGSSSPDVVPTPDSPEPVTLLPNVATEVRIEYRVAAGAQADQSAAVVLRAVDIEDDRWSASGSLTVSAGLVMADPSVTLDGPPERTQAAGEPFDVTWTVTNRTNASRMLILTVAPSSPGHAKLVSAAGMGRLPFSPGETRTMTIRLRLAEEVDGGTRSELVAVASDAEAPAHRGSVSLDVVTAALLAPPVIGEPGPRMGDPGAPVTLAWSVTNESNQVRAYHLTPGVADSEHLEILAATGTGEQSVARGQAHPVTVTYRIRPGSVAGRTSTVTLGATDRGAPALSATGAATLGTNSLLAAPAVSAPESVTAVPGDEVTATWTVRNGTNAPRMLVIEPDVVAGEDASIVSSEGDGEAAFSAFESRVVHVRYRIQDGSLAGARSAPLLSVRDKLAPAYAASGRFQLTTAADFRDPVLTAPADRAADPGAVSQGLFRLVNRSNTPRTFRLSAGSSTPQAVAVVDDPGSVWIPAFGSRDITVDARVAATAPGGAQGIVVLTAVDGEQPARTGSGRFVVTVNPVYLAPALAWRGLRHLRPGEAASDTATLANRSNVPVEYCFSVGVIAGSVDPGLVVGAPPAAPGCRTLGAAGSAASTADIAVGYRTDDRALAGWSNVVTLTATGRTPIAVSARAEMPVTAELLIRSPVWESIPVSPMRWDDGDERALGYTFRNTSNGARTFCVQIGAADESVLVRRAPAPRCGLRVEPRDTIRVVDTMRAAGATPGVRVTVAVYDAEDPALRDEGGFHNVVRDVRPVARWEPPSLAYVRRWLTFDGSSSASPVGAPIARYIWTWGLLMQRWDPEEGRFVYTGTWETAHDEEREPVVRRAYDVQGTYQVCLTVVDDAGRSSAPACHVITPLRPTVARVAWRYRGWWTDREWCLDVWWDSQCDPEHGNGRWEIDLRPSGGDVPLLQAFAVVRVKLHNTDDPDRPATVSFTGNAGTLPGWGTYTFARDIPEAVGRAQDGRWRVLSTVGTAGGGWPASPALGDHPLVLNVNLADATGAFDSGPHWVPDDVWITLHVQDADQRWTSATAYRDHDRGAWRQAYDTVVVTEAAPTAEIDVVELEDGGYRATGAGDSPAGRIVDGWWEVTAMGPGARESSWTVRGPTVEVRPGKCERITLTYMVRDDAGRIGGASRVVEGETGRICAETEPV